LYSRASRAEHQLSSPTREEFVTMSGPTPRHSAPPATPKSMLLRPSSCWTIRHTATRRREPPAHRQITSHGPEFGNKSVRSCQADAFITYCLTPRTFILGNGLVSFVQSQRTDL